MREVYNKSKDSNYSMSEHNPIELLSKDPEVVRNWIKQYFTTGKIKFKLYKNGLIWDITDNDIDAISEFLQGGLLQLLERYRNLNKYSHDYILEVYNYLMNTDDSPFESIHDYFKSFFDTHFNSFDETTLTPLQRKWKIYLDYVVSLMPKEMLVKWIDYSETEESIDKCENPVKWKLIDIKLIDLDLKPLDVIKARRKSWIPIFEGYINSQFGKYKLTS